MADHALEHALFAGRLVVDPPLVDEEADLIGFAASASLYATDAGDRIERMVSGVLPEHPAGESRWLACEDGCCLILRGTTCASEAVAWLSYLKDRFLGSEHRITGMLVGWRIEADSFTSICGDGERIWESPVRGPRSRPGRPSSGTHGPSVVELSAWQAGPS
jgi:hypothetical protein